MKRRDVLKGGLAVAGAASLSAQFPGFARAAAPAAQLLSVVRRSIEVTGRAASVFGLLRPDGSRGLRFSAGDSFVFAYRS